MPQITLADIKVAADAKYGPLVIDMGDGSTVTLLNVLRMPKPARTKLMGLQRSMQAGEIDELAAADRLPEMIRLIAASKGEADRLLEAVGDDLAALQEVIARYSAETQPGEAPASPS